jgi:hypothetical protein
MRGDMIVAAVAEDKPAAAGQRVPRADSMAEPAAAGPGTPLATHSVTGGRRRWLSTLTRRN